MYLVQLVWRAEDDEGDLAVAQHAQLVGLLHDAEFTFVERHLQIKKKRVLSRKWSNINLNGVSSVHYNLFCISEILFLTKNVFLC